MKSIENKIRFGFGLALATLLIIGAVSYRTARGFVETFRSVEHTQTVLHQLNETLVALLNAETGERGYALTGNQLFLQAIEPGKAVVEEKLRTLRKLTADNPLQQQRLNELKPLIEKKLQFINCRRATQSWRGRPRDPRHCQRRRQGNDRSDPQGNYRDGRDRAPVARSSRSSIFPSTSSMLSICPVHSHG